MGRNLTAFSAIMTILLLIGVGGTVLAQTSAAPVLSGYFVGINGRQSGPYDTAGLRQLISSGQLTRDTLVWKEGMANWAAASTVAELAPLLPAGPPPLPPPLPSSSPSTSSVQSQQAASQAVQVMPWGRHPVGAGFVNSFFGIWSFTNGDISDGLLTAGIEAGGIVLSLIGSSFYQTWYYSGGSYQFAMFLYYAGYGSLVGGSIYGFYKGYTQYNKKVAAARSARSFAEALGDNPLNNISLVAFPTSDGKSVAGALTYSVSY